MRQHELAARLGVTSTSVSRYENGREPSRQVLKKLADVAEFAGVVPLRDFFEDKRRREIVARIENLPSGGTQRRVTVEDIAQWAAIAEDIASNNKVAYNLTEKLEGELKTGAIKLPQVQSQLGVIRETIRMGLISAADLGEDVELYIVPPDRPGTISYDRYKEIKSAKDRARKTPKED